MHRSQAIDLLCHEMLEELSSDERLSFILDWWSLDDSDPEFRDLPAALKSKMNTLDEPELEDLLDSLYNPLILLGLRIKFIGVRNEYLQQRLHALTNERYCIKESAEKLHPCPCCSYCTLPSLGSHNICPVCFWEDSGHVHLTDYSGPNRMSLAEAKNNFETFGAISLSALRFVDPEGKEKWSRDRIVE